MLRIARALLLVSICTTPAWASTWVVDPNPGPGVDFTTIAAATAAAAPGDVILVHAGTYAGFTLSSGAQVLGQSGVVVAGPITIANVAAGPRATIARMTTRAILVSHCSATVLVEDVAAHPMGSEAVALGFDAAIAVDSSADVRLRNVDATCTNSAGFVEAALNVLTSRVEITQSLLVGVNGIDDVLPHATDGGDGIVEHGASDVHVSSSTVLGGNGGAQNNDQFPSFTAGNGGQGIRVADAAARLLVTGLSTNLVRGGQGGIAPTDPACSQDGHPGSGVAVAVGAQARLSGATIQGALAQCPIMNAPDVAGPFTTPVRADPSLTVTGTIAQGQQVTFTLRGAPGSAARLRLGRQAIIQMLPGVFEDRLTVPLRTYDLTNLPQSGQATFSIVLPFSLPQGFLLVAQASTISSTGDVTLTQSVPISLH